MLNFLTLLLRAPVIQPLPPFAAIALKSIHYSPQFIDSVSRTKSRNRALETFPQRHLRLPLENVSGVADIGYGIEDFVRPDLVSRNDGFICAG